MASSSTSSESAAGTTRYPYPCHVNTSNFLSVKLHETNYNVWQEQMLCLIEAHGMEGFIDGTFRNPEENEAITEANYGEWKRSDTLVKGWIFGSVCESVMEDLVGLQTTDDVWTKLRTAYGIRPSIAPPRDPTKSTSKEAQEVEVEEDDEEEEDDEGEEGVDEALDLAASVYRAMQSGKWDTACELLVNNESLLTAKLNAFGQTAVHLAVETGKNLRFLENLLKALNPELLPEMVDDNGYNPAHTAAIVGNTKAAKMLVKENPCVLFIADNRGNLPIHKAASTAHKPTFEYFHRVSKRDIEFSQQEGYLNPFEGSNGARFLHHVIIEGFIDAAYDFLKKHPDMASVTFEGLRCPIASLAGNKGLYYSGTKYNFYQRFVYSCLPIDNNIGDTDKVRDIENQCTTKCKKSYFHSVVAGIYDKLWKMTLLHVLHIKHLKEDKEKHNSALMLLKFMCSEIFKPSKIDYIEGHTTQAMDLAAKNDTPEAIEEIVKHHPDAIWVRVDGYSIINIAIINRNEKVYNAMIHQLSINKKLLKASRDKDGNNLLHSTGRLAPIHKLNLVSGAALQMQRELQWFQEVEKFMEPGSKEEKNKTNETPMMVFRREHKELRKEGEEWMKKTADSYTITAALIITIVFAAAITVPGGNNGDNGKAFYATKPTFIMFAAADAISLFTSTTTLLLFQSILTARYNDEDFLFRLPNRLILGLVTLFLSVTSLMIAFSAILYIMFVQGRELIMIPVGVLTCFPIIAFVRLQFPLLGELVSSTYGRGIFGKGHDYKKERS